MYLTILFLKSTVYCVYLNEGELSAYNKSDAPNKIAGAKIKYFGKGGGGVESKV